MRVIKGNTVKYVSFQSSLPSLSKTYSGNKPRYLLKPDSDTNSSGMAFNKMFSELMDYVSLINKADSIQKVNHLVYMASKNYARLQEPDFFLLENNNTELVSPVTEKESQSSRFINNAYKEGILEWAFNSRAPRSIPVYNTLSLNEEQSQYLIIPLFNGGAPAGIFTALHNGSIEKESTALNYINLIVNYAFQRINILTKNEEIKTAYNSLQAYQSKLSNDYKLSAVGELAGEVLEEILDPLQVIYMSIDLLKTSGESNEVVAAIKNQVKKIESSTARLRRFADRKDYSSLKVVPCDLNKVIENYYSIISSSLEKKQVECILDLEEKLPSILTHPDLINQLLINVFSLLTADYTRYGGVLIQTQHVRDLVKLTFISTSTTASLQDNSGTSDPNYKIISQIIKRHEGEINISSAPGSGSRIEIKFPLKRKIRS